MKRLTAGVAGALTALLTACGSSSSVPSGAAVFASSCSGCHSLIGNESRHTQGGDLLGYGFTRPVLLELAREMPLRHALTGPQLQAVVDYVLRAERKASSHR